LVGRKFQTSPRTSSSSGANFGRDNKRCIVCKKEGYWSTRHLKEDADKAWAEVKRSPDYKRVARQFLQSAEGVQPSATAFDTLIDLPSDSDEGDPPMDGPDHLVTYLQDSGVADARRVL